MKQPKDKTYDLDKYWITSTKGLATILISMVLSILAYIAYDVIKLTIEKW